MGLSDAERSMLLLLEAIDQKSRFQFLGQADPLGAGPARSNLDRLVSLLRDHASECSSEALDAVAALPDQTVSGEPLYHSDGELYAYEQAVLDCSEARTLAEEELGRRPMWAQERDSVASLLERICNKLLPDHRRMAAARQLGRSGSSDAVEPLIEALQAGGESVREAAAHALAELADERALAVILQHVSDPTPWTKSLNKSMERALTRIISTGDVELFLGHLATTEGAVRRRLIGILGQLRDKRSAGGLVALLRESADQGDRKTLDRVIHALEEIGSGAIDAVVSALREEEPTVRWAAANLLARIGDDTVIPALTPLANDSDEGVRQAAISALEQIESRA